ncbi:TerD family protein [Nocardia sp. NPDC050413]|uniref:TerD family protein n=1 Tax=Nocardia sp. NPDC050413 TaxID=3155784 RepID=UPI0033FDB06D
MVGLIRGQNAPLCDHLLTIAIAGARAGAVDLFVIQLGPDEKVRHDQDLIFYNAPVSPEGAVQLVGDRVEIDLLRVPATVRFLRVAVAVDDATAGSLATITGLGVAVTSPSGSELIAHAVGLTSERSAVLLEIYRRDGGWKARNVSAGWNDGVAALLIQHGVEVDTTPAPTTHAARTDNTRLDAAVPQTSAPLRTPVVAVDGTAELTAYPVEKQFTVTRDGATSSYNVPSGFEMLLLDLEHMFEVVLAGADLQAENLWWEIAFDPADAIDEYTARRISFFASPQHIRPLHGIRVVFEEDGMTSTHGYRPDLRSPEWRGGAGAGPCEVKELICDLHRISKRAIEDGYDFRGPWMVRIIDDPDDGTCLEAFAEAAWTKPKRWRVAPQ